MPNNKSRCNQLKFGHPRKPIKSCCNLANCFFTFYSSRLIAANMLMDPPEAIYIRDCLKPIPCPWDVLFTLLAG